MWDGVGWSGVGKALTVPRKKDFGGRGLEGEAGKEGGGPDGGGAWGRLGWRG